MSDRDQNTKSTEKPVEFGAIFRRLGPVGPMAIICSTVPIVAFVTTPVWINPARRWLLDFDAWGIPLYLLVFAILSGTAIIPARLQSILAGWTFGFALGLPAAVAAFLGGAAVGYVIARRASGDRVTALVSEHPKWKAVHQALVVGGFWKTLGIVALLRFPPNSPFALTNVVMAAARVAPLPYFAGTLLGMTPRTAVVVLAAARLTEFEKLDKPWWLLAGGIAITIVALVILAVIGNRAIARITGVTSTPGASD